MRSIELVEEVDDVYEVNEIDEDNELCEVKEVNEVDEIDLIDLIDFNDLVEVPLIVSGSSSSFLVREPPLHKKWVSLSLAPPVQLIILKT